MKLIDILTDNIGPAPKDVCNSRTPDKDLPASWLASCRSQGLRRRDSDRDHEIDGKRQEVGRKKMISGKGWSTPTLSEGKVLVRSTEEAICLNVK